MTHQFKIELAERYGLLEAILLDHIVFWIAKNEANEINQFEGNTWTYNSIKAFCELFPYASEKKLRNALKHIEDEGLIATGNFNKSTYDRTKWYALTQKGRLHLVEMGYSILPKGQMEVSEKSNGLTQKGKPIPSTTTSTNTSATTNNIRPSETKKEFETLWSLYPRKQGKEKAYGYYERARKEGATYEEVEQGIYAYQNYIKETETDMQFVKMGSTFFSQRAWNDDFTVYKRVDKQKGGSRKELFEKLLRENGNL